MRDLHIISPLPVRGGAYEEIYILFPLLRMRGTLCDLLPWEKRYTLSKVTERIFHTLPLPVGEGTNKLLLPCKGRSFILFPSPFGRGLG